MSEYRVVRQDEFVPDPGGNGLHYPLPKHISAAEKYTLITDQTIQPIHYNLSAIVGVFNEWFQGFFNPNYFKSVNITTQMSIEQFKSFRNGMYKMEQPWLAINPNNDIEIVQDSLFSVAAMSHYAPYTPDDPITGVLPYSGTVYADDVIILGYRPATMRYRIDIMIMTPNVNQAMNVRTHLNMRIAHNNEWPVTRTVPFLIPESYIKNIAAVHGVENHLSDKFLTTLNAHSPYPIKLRIHPGSQKATFHILIPRRIRFISSDFAASDTMSRTDAIDLGARVTDSFSLVAEVPSEYHLLLAKEYLDRPIVAIEDDINAVTYISPFMSDLPWPTEHGGFPLINRVDVQFQRDDDPTLNVLELISTHYPLIGAELVRMLENPTSIIDELIRVRVFPNGSKVETGSVLSNKGMLTVLTPKDNQLYSVNIYLNTAAINQSILEKEIQLAGTVEITNQY